MKATKISNRTVGLSIGDMERGAPAMFAHRPSDKVSGEYQFLRTMDLLPAFSSAGLAVVEAAQAASRTADGREVSKHLLRFQPRDLLGRSGEVLPEIILENSHNTARAVVIALGMFRLVCSNGMRVGTTFEEFKIRHIGTGFLDQVVAGIGVVTKQIPLMGDAVRRMIATPMSVPAQNRFAELGAKLRWPEFNGVFKHSVLRTRRSADQQATVWHTLNAIQENLIRGGQWLGGGSRSRQVKSIDAERRINQGLWDMATRYMETGDVEEAVIVPPQVPIGAPSTFVVGL